MDYAISSTPVRPLGPAATRSRTTGYACGAPRRSRRYESHERKNSFAGLFFVFFVPSCFRGAPQAYPVVVGRGRRLVHTLSAVSGFVTLQTRDVWDSCRGVRTAPPVGR